MPASRRVAVALIAALAGAASVAPRAQSHAAPSHPASARTPWGAPDLDGTYNYATMTPLERPREFAGRATISDAEAAAYEQRTIARQASGNATAGPDWWDPAARHLVDNRTSLIVDPEDGRVPPLTAAAQQAAADRQRARGGRRNTYDGPEDLALKERCLYWEIAGPPMMPGVYNNTVQLVQTKDYIVIVNEMIHDARIVPLDGRPHGTMPRWMGDARGHWDGDTLVVDTVGFTSATSVRGSDANLHLTERFTRTNADTIDYRATLEDASVWTRPWTIDFSLRRTTDQMYEYACHEGNYRSVEGMLRSSRTQDK